MFEVDFITEKTFALEQESKPEIHHNNPCMKKDAEIQVDLLEAPTLELFNQIDSNPEFVNVEECSDEDEENFNDITDQFQIGEIVGNYQPEENYETKEEFILPWFMGSEFECKICGEMFFANKKLRTHINKNHMKVKTYIDKYKQLESKTVYIKCKLCDKDMERNYSGIKNHLYEHHDRLDLKEYERKFSIHCFRIVNNGKTNKDFQVKWNNLDEFKKGSCIYQCQKCDFCTAESDTFWVHVNSEHGIDEKIVYTDLHGNPMVLKSKITCMVENCFELILHNETEITEHLSQKHKNAMEFGEFFSQYYRTGFEVLSFEEWKNQCEYQCKICFERANMRQLINRHIAKAHKLKMCQYSDKYGESNIKKVFYTCKICQKVVLWETNFLKSHIRWEHNIELKQYFKEYVKMDRDESIQIEKNQVDKIKVRRTRVKKAKLSPIKKTRPKIDWNQCKYKCNSCNYVAGYPGYFGNHWKFCDREDRNLPNALRYQTILLKRHKCKICGKEILCRKELVKYHLEYTHKMSLQKYEETFESLLGSETLAYNIEI